MVNQKWEHHRSEFFTIFENFDLNEESRFQFIKLNVSQLIQSFQGLNHAVSDVIVEVNAANFETKVKAIEDSIRQKKFGLAKAVENHLGKTNQIKKEEFISFEGWKKLYGNNLVNQKVFKEIEDSEAIEEKHQLDILVCSILGNLTSKNQAIFIRSQADQMTKNLESILGSFQINTEPNGDDGILKLIEDTELEKMFSVSKLRKHFLEKITSEAKLNKDYPISKAKWGQLKYTTTILISTLNFKGLNGEELADYEQIYLLMNVLTKFYKEDSTLKEKKYLGACLKNQIKWDKVINWEELANYILQRKKLEEGHRVAKQNSRRHTEILAEAVSNKTHLTKTVKSSVIDRKLEIDDNSIKLTVVDEINVYLLHLELEQESDRLRFDQDSYKMLSSILDKKGDVETLKKLNDDSLYRKKKFNKHGNLYAITLALDYLGPDDHLLNLLFVSKEWKRVLQKKVYKVMLLGTTDEKISIHRRVSIWKTIIKLDSFKINYLEIKRKYQEEMKSRIPVDDIINLDITRSFFNHPHINKPVLVDLLKLYARYDKRVSYCQGMNYIMGFLYSLFQNEETTFMFFVALINTHMHKLFMNDLKNMQLLFYQLDRLIAILQPDLALHFKKEKIEANLFSPSWFITLFTTVCQVSYKSHLLMRIWDFLLLEGWKGFLKCCIYLLTLHKTQLLRDKFDQTICFFNDMTSSELFTNFKYGQHLEILEKHPELADSIPGEGKIIRSFPQKASEIRITDQLLRQLEEEYKAKGH